MSVWWWRNKKDMEYTCGEGGIKYEGGGSTRARVHTHLGALHSLVSFLRPFLGFLDVFEVFLDSLLLLLQVLAQPLQPLLDDFDVFGGKLRIRQL